MFRTLSLMERTLPELPPLTPSHTLIHTTHTRVRLVYLAGCKKSDDQQIQNTNVALFRIVFSSQNYCFAVV